MKKHRSMLVVAGFWHILKLSVAYYLLLTVLAPESGRSDQFLLLWFGSPAMMAAALFFFPWFRPERYSQCLGPARLTLGFDAAAAASLCAYCIISSLVTSGALFQDAAQLRIVALCVIAIAVDLLLLWQIPGKDVHAAGEV